MSAYKTRKPRKMEICCLLLTVLIFQLGGCKVDALTCLTCDYVVQPRDCDTVMTCPGFDDVCYVERRTNSFGEEGYSLGCLKQHSCRNTTSVSHTSRCSLCCSKDLCNHEGCGEPGFPSARGPICYNCQSPLPEGRCHSIEMCRVGEVCSISGKSNYGTLLYKSRCIPQDACGEHHVGALIGKRASGTDSIARSYEPQDCYQCCPSDICNRNCYNNVSAHDCSDLLTYSSLMTSGIYNITTPITRTKIQVYCDMETDGGGWTIFQKRFDGSVDFYRSFHDYENGFGNVNSEHWLGLKSVYELTSTGVHQLRTDIKRVNGSKGHEVYDNFSLQPGSNYTLSLGERVESNGVTSGWLDAELPYLPVGMAFSTYDHDVDRADSASCAVEKKGGWWYNSCYTVNLNGLYLPGQNNGSSMSYDDTVGLLSSTIMFRKKQ